MSTLYIIILTVISLEPSLVHSAGMCYKIVHLHYHYCYYYDIFLIDIIVYPQSVNTTLNSTIDFTCEANTLDITFLVDNTLALAADIINRGFTQQGVEDLGNGKWRGVLLAKAFEYNNNTNISCRAIGSQTVYSDIAVLRIQGELML